MLTASLSAGRRTPVTVMSLAAEEFRTETAGGGAHYRDGAIDLIAGSMGGAASVLVGQPLDTVKVKMQAFPEVHTNLLGCFRTTFAGDGLRGLYAGTVPALAANVAENSVLFCAYGFCQKLVARATRTPDVAELSVVGNATAGFVAAFFSSFTLCPTELVKCRLQAMRETHGRLDVGPFGLTKRILRAEGVPGLFRGLTATMAREMPGYFFFFGGYEATRALLTPPGLTKDEIGAARTIVAGGVSGVLLWVAIFPADVVKSRIQVEGSREPMLRVMRTILQKEGVMALYNGLGPTLLRTFPATGVLFLAYELTKKSLHSLFG